MNILILITLIFWNLFQFYNKLRKVKTFYKFFYLALLIVHFSAFIVFYRVSIDIMRDSFLFYENALNAKSLSDFGFLGSQFMSVIVYPFAKMGITYFTVSLLFASISFYIFLNYFEYFFTFQKTRASFQISLIFLFLTPSLHYWTAGLSKEALIVFFMGIIFFQVIKNKFFSVNLIIAMIFILLIRPYVFVILIFSFGIHILISKDVSLKLKRGIILFTVLSLIVLVPILKQFLSIDTLSINGFTQRYESIILYSKVNGMSSIDLSKSNYFDRIFLVLLRPFFYDAKSLFQYIVSIENLLFLSVMIKFGYDFLKGKVSMFLKKDVLILSSSVILILFYSIYMYNLGLASRMRCMFIPYIYTYIFLSYYRSKNEFKEKIS